GASARDTEFVRVHTVAFGMVTDEADGPVNIADRLRNGKLRLRAMHDCEDGVAAIHEWLDETEVDHFPGREKPAAHHENDGATVGFGGLEYIHRERHAILMAIDDILRALVFLSGPRTDDDSGQEAKQEQRAP